MKLSSRIALLAFFVAVIMACLITYGNANPADVPSPTNNTGTVTDPSPNNQTGTGSATAPSPINQTGTVSVTTPSLTNNTGTGPSDGKPNNNPDDIQNTPASSAVTELSYSGSNSIILSAFCAISIILGAKL